MGVELECSFTVVYVPYEELSEEARMRQKIAYQRLADLLIEQQAKERIMGSAQDQGAPRESE